MVARRRRLGSRVLSIEDRVVYKTLTGGVRIKFVCGHRDRWAKYARVRGGAWHANGVMQLEDVIDELDRDSLAIEFARRIDEHAPVSRPS